MINKMRLLWVAVVAMAVVAMAGCQKEETIMGGGGDGVHFSATVKMAGGGTKALTDGGVKTFAVGDRIAVVYKNMSGATVKAVSDVLASEDPIWVTMRPVSSSQWLTFHAVGGKQGIMLLPDHWTLPGGCTFTPGLNGSWSTDTYDAAAWAKMELAGAVFLPDGSFREATNVSDAGACGYYWSCSRTGYASYVYSINFGNAGYNPNNSFCSMGCSVRLVRDLNFVDPEFDPGDDPWGKNGRPVRLAYFQPETLTLST